MRKFPIVLVAVSQFLALNTMAAAAPGARDASAATRYWFAPGPSAPGVLDLFSDETFWPRSREMTQVFQLFGGAILNDDPATCPMCADITFNNLVARGAFDKIARWGMKFALETGAIKWGTPEGCDASALIREAKTIINKLHSVGARLHYFALDNPSYSGDFECHMSDEQIGAVVAHYTHEVRAEYERVWPGEDPVKFILVDNYAFLGADRMLSLTDQMLAHGAFIDGFHPDLDLRWARAAKVHDTKLRSDLRKLIDYARARGMEFGFLLTGMNGASDRAYHDETLQWVRKFKWLLPEVPFDGVLESWEFYKKPDGTFSSHPAAGPETSPYSHTRLMLDIDQVLHRNVSWFEVLFDRFWVP